MLYARFHEIGLNYLVGTIKTIIFKTFYHVLLIVIVLCVSNLWHIFKTFDLNIDLKIICK